MKVSRVERAALADLMESLGPDTPTLCEGWTTRDLAAHLVVRATRIDAGVGILIRAVAGHTKKVQDRVAAQDWSTLIAKVRRRPWWAVLSDEALNAVEYFVHHEDVRRAQEGWRPRPLSPEFAAALWSHIGSQTRLVRRQTPAAVTINAPGLGTATAGRGGPPVTITGDPGELLLFFSGRQKHSLVELDGPDEITARLRTTHLGI